MRRVGRWMMRGVTILSLVVCVASLGLWVRSYFVTDYLDYYYGPPTHPRQRYTGVGSCRGSYLLETFWRRLTPQATWGLGIGHTGIVYLRRVPSPQWGSATGLSHEIFNEHLRPDPDGYAGTVGFHFVVPHWSVALLAAVLPMGQAIAIRRRRNMQGHCPACRYDLTGNISGICPECGKAIAA